jgi:RHS repeat-associated protein
MSGRGDNIVWEMRGPGASTETADRLELEYAVGQEYGIVGYTHAGGVDRPLVAYKTLGGNAGAVVVPHMNWRGLFSTGTNSAGGTSTTPVEWPGFRTTANHSKGETQAITKNWMGSLLEGQRDAGGQMYMRNRYYDPATGQFTQTDPIGIAGGLNTYGFAAGDPIRYRDSFGLSAEENEAQNDSTPAKRHDRCAVATILTNYIGALTSNPGNFTDDAFPTEFDWKFSARDDLFQVGDQWLRADQFGNFAAGYASFHVFGHLGWIEARWVGFQYASDRDQNGQRTSNEHWSDLESAPMINAGARRAGYDDSTVNGSPAARRWGIPAGERMQTLTSRAGCDSRPTSGPDPT